MPAEAVDFMTTHYIDIRLLPDPEFSHAHLFGALYAKFHRALVQLKATDVGVSFPLYRMQPRTMGDVMRLHGTRSALQRLMDTDWLRGMHDHVACTGVLSIPDQVKHRIVTRRQFKTNVERLRRRRMRRKGETEAQVVTAIPESVERQPELPYVQLRSASTGQTFRLFVLQGEVEEAPIDGDYNSYGLSMGGSVPWF